MHEFLRLAADRPSTPSGPDSVATFLCDWRKRSYADSVAERLLAHHSSVPSTPAAHMTRTSPPMIQ